MDMMKQLLQLHYRNIMKYFRIQAVRIFKLKFCLTFNIEELSFTFPPYVHWQSECTTLLFLHQLHGDSLTNFITAELSSQNTKIRNCACTQTYCVASFLKLRTKSLTAFEKKHSFSSHERVENL